MAYKLSSGLIAADETIYKLITKHIKIKNKFVEKNLNKVPETMEYSQTVHGLDLLQYLVVEENPTFALSDEISDIKRTFEISKRVLDEKTIEDIQYCIDRLQEYIDAWHVINNIKKQCK